jgi:hypothetical protein
MSSTSKNPNQGQYYAAAGDVTQDNQNAYLYDGEGHISTPPAKNATPNLATTTSGPGTMQVQWGGG